ncbi:ATP-grasp domain-containing protein [Synechococcus sp. BIOS-U3-1]|uniref:ATP-grasp domain-containing protein n=1 Tax=Synechococcus sp. BIOS-U3-1 TaxID=1400865 RepID=UPI00210720B4|nr:ATP-grasp domain-containing protein [Synechococcus sp. BIOS-U3-1]
MVTKMPNAIPTGILITSAGRRGELIKIWKKSALSTLGSEARIYSCDLNPSLSAACQLADQSFKSVQCTEPDYPAQILELCLANDIKMVIPTIDTELQVLAESREAFDAAGVQLVVSDPGLVRLCRDKRRTADLFASLSILTPKILDPERLIFPCFMKPVGGSCSQGIKTILSADHLAPVDTSDSNNLFQELVPNHWIEYTVDLCYSKSGDLLGCVPRQRLEVRGGEISKGATRKDNVLRTLKKRLGTLKGARGVITLQIFVDPSRDKMLGIEINPRFGGGYPMSHAAGADYPSLLIREYLLAESIGYEEAWEANLILLRYDTMEFYSSPMPTGIQ